MTDRTLMEAAITAASHGDRAQFAALFGYAPSQLSRWLTGVRQLPRDVRRTCEAILVAPADVVAAYQAAYQAAQQAAET